jgi:ELWxxDGT repeat protein
MRQERRRHAAPASGRVRTATISGSLAATAALGLAASAEPADAAGGFDAALVKDINASGNGDPSGITEFGGALFFAASDGPQSGGTHATELWRSDGTTPGTQLFKDINTNPLSNSGESGPYNFAVAGSTLFFSAYSDGDGYELWKTDGTVPGTQMVEDINPGPNGSYPSHLTNVGGTLLFRADDGTNGEELWKSTDGTAPNTDIVEDINPSGGSGPQFLTDVGGTLFFAAYDGIDSGTASPPSGTELWKSVSPFTDATLVEDINASGDSGPSGLTNFGGTLLFAATDGPQGSGTHERELWKSTDGTAGNTDIVKDINSSSASNPQYLTSIGNTLFFRATDGGDDGATHFGDELWKSNGTEAGTQLVKDIFPMGNGVPSLFTDIGGGSFLFRARDSLSNYELWSSDGTTANTQLVKEIRPGPNGGNPTKLTRLGSNVFFRAYDGTSGTELWVSDGTDPGTAMVKDIRTDGGYGSYPDDLTALGDELFFQATDGPDNGTTHGVELWKAYVPQPAPPPGGGAAPPAPTTAPLAFDLKAAIRKCKKKFPKGPKRKKCIKKAKARA